jgi:hypothetical protein
MKLAVVLTTCVVTAAPARADDAVPVRSLLADPIELAAWLRDRDPVIEAAHAKIEAVRTRAMAAPAARPRSSASARPRTTRSGSAR